MTTIFYMDGCLYADKRNLGSGIPAVIRDSGGKIHVSKCRTFAYGVSGSDVYKYGSFESHLKKFLSIVHAMPTFEMVNAKHFAEMPDNKGVMDGIWDIQWIAMTNALVVCNVPSSPGDLYTHIADKRDVTAVGSGGMLAVGASYVTRDPEKIFSVVSRFDSVSSKEFDCIRESDLDSFLVPKSVSSAMDRVWKERI